MRRLLVFIISLMLILALAVSASADTAASKLVIQAVVNADGSCQVTQTLTVRLEHANEELLFPVPTEAQHIRLGSGRVRTRSSNGVLYVDLSSGGSIAGEPTFVISYTLDNVLQTTETDTLQVQLPLMSGFNHPVERLEFTVTLPGEVTAKPAFSSGYHQSSIEQELAATYSGFLVSGNSLKTLKDHETLSMTLDVDKTMFAHAPILLTDTSFDDYAMAVCGILAFLYWLIFLRCAPILPEKTTTPPAGYSAGEMGSVLTMQGAKVNMIVLTWAQLGYILIQLDRNQRVILHKRMEMGNERSAFEQKCFQNLFAGKREVDTTSHRYAAFCSKMEVLSSNVRPLLKKSSGNPRIFRLLSAGIGLFGGFALGVALGAGAWLQWFLAVILGIAGGISAWHMQTWADSLFLLDKSKVWSALAQLAVWVLLGVISNVALVGILVPLSQLLAGLMVSFGGRRTEDGRHAAAQVLGLRKHLSTADKNELTRILMQDPEYFHTMAPYALALGVDWAFSRQAGGSKLPQCTYLTTGMDGDMTPAEWLQLLRSTARSLDERKRRMPIDRILGK
jgi:hypothetical protein